MATNEIITPIQCAVCFTSKDKRQPRVLPCQHSFCTECLITWHDKRVKDGQCGRREVECPTCRTKATLPPGGVKDLPIDINVEAFAEVVKQVTSVQINCHLCSREGKTRRGTALCHNCHRYFCKECSSRHLAIAAFSAHEITTNICQLHGAVFQCVCLDCSCGVCDECIYSDKHKNHNLKDFKFGIFELRKKLFDSVVSVKPSVMKLEKAVAANRQICSDQFCASQENMKRALDTIKLEVDRINELLQKHEASHKKAVDLAFNDHDTMCTEAIWKVSVAEERLKRSDSDFLDSLSSPAVKFSDIADKLPATLHDVPDPGLISCNTCRLENVDKAIEALKGCDLVCGISDTLSLSSKSPTQVLKVECGSGRKIYNPWRLCGTPDGDVVVCMFKGGPVFKVSKTGEETLIHEDGSAACVNDGDVYVISSKGDAVLQIKQDGTKINHPLNPAVKEPHGIAVLDGTLFIFTPEHISKRSFSDPVFEETIKINLTSGREHHFLTVTHEGTTKFVFCDPNKNQVIVLDESGSQLNIFGGPGSKDGLFLQPRGISMMSNGHLLVADRNNNRLVECTIDGTFVRNLLTREDGLSFPVDTASSYPFLWIAQVSTVETPFLKLFKFH